MRRNPEEAFLQASASWVRALHRICTSATSLKLALEIMLLANEREPGSSGGSTGPVTAGVFADRLGVSVAQVNKELKWMADPDSGIVERDDAKHDGWTFECRLRVEILTDRLSAILAAEREAAARAAEEPEADDEPDEFDPPAPTKRPHRRLRVFREPLVLTAQRQRVKLSDDVQLAISEAEHIETVCDFPGFDHRVVWDLTICGNVIRSRFGAVPDSPADPAQNPKPAHIVAEKKAKTVVSNGVSGFLGAHATSITHSPAPAPGSSGEPLNRPKSEYAKKDISPSARAIADAIDASRIREKIGALPPKAASDLAAKGITPQNVSYLIAAAQRPREWRKLEKPGFLLHLVDQALLDAAADAKLGSPTVSNDATTRRGTTLEDIRAEREERRRRAYGSAN